MNNLDKLLFLGEDRVVASKANKQFNYIDLFAGCGGLSLGLERQGGKLLFAIERSPMAAETFMANLIKPGLSDQEWESYLTKPAEVQLEEGLLVQDIVKILRSKKIREAIKGKISKNEVDLVVGGPPCQGFSMAGQRKATDERNQLPHRFLDLVGLSNPKLVIMENVLGMNHKFNSQGIDSHSAYSQVALALSKTGMGYVVQKLLLNAKHYGAPQDRARLFLLGVRKDIAAEKKLVATPEIWTSRFLDEISDLPNLAPEPTISSAEVRTVAEAIMDLADGSNFISSYLEEIRNSQAWGLSKQEKIANTALRKHGVRATTKFELYLALKSLGLSPLLMRSGLGNSLKEKRDMELKKLKDVIYPVLTRDGQVLAGSHHQFKKIIDLHVTKKHSQRVLELTLPSPTVITAPDDYIHPTLPRVLSVREMARLQGFPDAFIFRSKETTGGMKRRTEVPQYSQVGNAVSPYVGKSLGYLVSKLLA